MPDGRIRYQGGYKYQLAEDYTVALPPEIHGLAVTDHSFIELTFAGVLTIRKGYAWDGPSGPTVDTANFMRGSLVHDALYQLIREGHLSRSLRAQADDLLRAMCREDGMSALRAWWVWKAVRWFARSATLPSHRRPIKEAP